MRTWPTRLEGAPSRLAGAAYDRGVGLHDLYEFELVPTDPDAVISGEHWTRMMYHLLHLQPAKNAELVGDPAKAIRVQAFGGTEVAPALHAEIERLACTTLRVVTPTA